MADSNSHSLFKFFRRKDNNDPPKPPQKPQPNVDLPIPPKKKQKIMSSEDEKIVRTRMEGWKKSGKYDMFEFDMVGLKIRCKECAVVESKNTNFSIWKQITVKTKVDALKKHIGLGKQKKGAGQRHRDNVKLNKEKEALPAVIQNNRRQFEKVVKKTRIVANQQKLEEVNKIEINLRLAQMMAQEKISSRKFKTIRENLTQTIKLLDKGNDKEKQSQIFLHKYKNLTQEIEKSENEMKILLKETIESERECLLEDDHSDEQDDFTNQDKEVDQLVKTETEIKIENSFKNLKSEAKKVFHEATRVINGMRTKPNEIDEKHYDNKYTNKYYEILSSQIKKEVLNKIKRKKYFSILLDSSVDEGKIDELIVYLVTVNDLGEKENDLLCLIPLHKTSGEEICNALIEFLEKNKILKYFEKFLFGVGTDGASNMRGGENGFVPNLERRLDTKLFALHCIAHVTALCAKFEDGIVADKVDWAMKNVAADFSRSALKSASLLELQKALRVAQHKILRYCATRWLSRYECLKRIIEQIKPLFLFYENMSASETSNIRFSQLCNYRILRGLYVTLDILTPIHKFQKLVQSPSKNLLEILKQLEIVKSSLVELQTSQGVWETKFDELFDSTLHTFSDNPITFTTRMIQQVDNYKSDYLKSTLKDFTERTSSLVSGLKDFDLFSNFGETKDKNEIRSKIEGISSLFPRLNLSVVECYNEFIDLHKCFPSDVLPTIENQSKFVHQNPTKTQKYCNLKIVYTILLIFPFTTVLCESGFSHMNHIKNPFRNLMKNENLENLMFLVLYPSFNFQYRDLAHELIQKERFNF